MGINKYYGGKHRYASKIVEVIDKYANEHHTYIEPFCGWCSVLSKVVDRKIFNEHVASDANESIVKFFHESSRGTFVPPDDVSEEEYHILKNQQVPSALQAFAGICYSYGGIWFRSYGANSDPKHFGTRHTFPEKIMERVKKLKDVTFAHALYHEYANREECFFYLDPPYKGRRENYKNNIDAEIPFDTNEMWEFARKLSEKNTVLVSEYNAPEDFECVLEFHGRHDTEKVFKLKSLIA
jgi:DNA adenine methylase